MGEGRPVTKTIKAAEARQQFSQLINQVFRGETRVIVERSGIPVAAIISAEDLQRLAQWEAQRVERFKALDESWKAFEGVPLDEVEQEVTKAVAAARQKERRKLQRIAKAS